MIYRVLRPLTTGQQPGDVIDGGRLRVEAIEKLLEIAVKHKTTRVVKRWKREAREWLTAPNKQ
jgi:hypothetical protein